MLCDVVGVGCVVFVVPMLMESHLVDDFFICSFGVFLL